LPGSSQGGQTGTDKAALRAARAAGIATGAFGPQGRLTEDRSSGHTITSLAFGPDGGWLVTAGAEGAVKLWRPTAGGGWAEASTPVIPPPDRDFGQEVEQVIAVDPAGRRVAVRTLGAGRVTLHDLADGRPPADLVIPGAWRWNGLAFSPDGKRLVADSYDGETYGLRVWDLESGQLRDISQGLGTMTGALAFSPDGRWLACGGGEMVTVFDTSDFGRHLFVRGNLARGVAFSPNSRWLAFSSVQQGVVTLWDVVSNREVADLLLLDPDT
jgi:WD40 repeat protein